MELYLLTVVAGLFLWCWQLSIRLVKLEAKLAEYRAAQSGYWDQQIKVNNGVINGCRELQEAQDKMKSALKSKYLMN